MPLKKDDLVFLDGDNAVLRIQDVDERWYTVADEQQCDHFYFLGDNIGWVGEDRVEEVGAKIFGREGPITLQLTIATDGLTEAEALAKGEEFVETVNRILAEHGCEGTVTLESMTYVDDGV